MIGFIPAPEPGKLLFGAHRLLTSIFGPLNRAGLGSQDAGAGFAPFAQLGNQERTDVEPHPVVDVWLPAYGLLVQGFPAHKDVVGRFACENLYELALEIEGGSEAIIGAIDASGLIILLAINPVAQVGEGELIQGFATLAMGCCQLVIVHQSAEAIGIAIPDLPDEGAAVEQLAVLAEE